MKYLEREKQSSDDAAGSPSLARQHVLPAEHTATSTLLECAPSDSDHVAVGSFYEIDLTKLSTSFPDQLNSIRVVMVCEKTDLNVSVRFPSIDSLGSHFTDGSGAKQEGKKLPALDEKCVMGLDNARKALFRKIPTEELAEQRNLLSFWVSTSMPNERNASPDLNVGVGNVVSKKGWCWSKLKHTGMVQWGKRRQVRFLARHLEKMHEPDHDQPSSSIVKGKEDDDEKECGEEEEEEQEEEEVEEGGDQENMKAELAKNNRKRKHYGSGRTLRAKRAKCDKKNQIQVYNQSKRKAIKNSIDRWSVERYKLAEENMLKIMKEKGAEFGNPMLRPALRTEARKLIGDTGLLDHLLKHMAGKVAPGGADRFRRRHNADGAMEYWLERADLVNIRREAGVQDPYWTPPPGWKPGDNPSQDPICARELKELKQEIAKIKRDVQELVSKKQEEEQAIVATPSSCVTIQNLDNESCLVPLKEMYIELVNRKTKVAGQLMEISQSLIEMEEQIGRLKSAATPPLLMGPSPTPPPSGTECETEQVGQKKNKTAATNAAGDQEQDKDKAAEDKAAKIERLKSGFRICKPQGTFLWPNLAMSPPQVVVQLEDLLVVPTPPSVSSSSATSAPPPPPPNLLPPPQQPPGPGPHHPPSPVKKPLAERRPVTVTTCTNTTTINLNEVPKNQNDSEFGGEQGPPAPSLTYQRRNYTVTANTGMPHTEEKEEMVRNREQQQRGCTSSTSSSSCLSIGVETWLALATPNSSLDNSNRD